MIFDESRATSCSAPALPASSPVAFVRSVRELRGLEGGRGFIVATLARRVVSAALQAANADGWLQKSGVGRTTGSTGVSDAVGTLVFVLILIPVTIAALEKLLARYRS